MNPPPKIVKLAAAAAGVLLLAAGIMTIPKAVTFHSAGDGQESAKTGTAAESGTAAENETAAGTETTAGNETAAGTETAAGNETAAETETAAGTETATGNETAPEAESGLDRSVEEYADELIRRYEAELAETHGQGNIELDSSYEVVTDNDHYLSLRISSVLTQASSTQLVKIFTVEKSTGNVLTLGELFRNHPDTLNTVSENIKEQMVQQMQQDARKTYYLDTGNPGSDFKGLTGNESFYFDSQGQLVIVFNEYDVAPGYMGAVEFTIPQEVSGPFPQ